MTELKTLKDIPSSPNEDDYTDHSSYYRDISLRQEAIKWIKHIQKECNLAGIPKELGETTNIIWIKYFFN